VTYTSLEGWAIHGVRFALCAGVERKDAMTQRSLEAVVRRILNDEDLRDTFLNEPHRALLDLLERDTWLTHSEIAALTVLDATFWEQVAEQVEPAYYAAA
jgi:hypothetical protein